MTSFSSNSSLGILAGGDPVELWEEIVRNIDDSVWTDSAKMILNVAHGECVDAKVIVNHMRSLGVSDDEILRRLYLIDNYTFFTNYAKRLGFKNVIHGDFLEMEFDVEFDVILGNPPFSQQGCAGPGSSVQIYPSFFEKAINIADIVAMIMPISNTKKMAVGADLGKHNQLIRDNANVIEFVDDSMGVTQEMWYVICDNSDRVPQPLPFIGEYNNTIRWERGGWDHTKMPGRIDKTEDDNVTIYCKLGVNGSTKLYATSSEIAAEHRTPKSGYVVAMPETFSDSGWTCIEIIKCTGNESISRWHHVVRFNTKSQAKRFCDIVSGDDFIREACIMKKGQGMNKLSSASLCAINISKEDEDYIING